MMGSTIGNQISPTLCSIPVIARELRWKHSYQLWHKNFSSQIFIERYVDNRFAILKKLLMQQPAITEFMDEWFYNKPVQLEPVEDTHFLGAIVHVDARMVEPIIVSQKWQIKPPQSAGSLSSLLMPFTARCHLILQQTHPKSHIPHYLTKLKEVYLKAGFYSKDLQPIIDKVLRKAGLTTTTPKSNSLPNPTTTVHHFLSQQKLTHTFPTTNTEFTIR
jgi:hypothetical protein